MYAKKEKIYPAYVLKHIKNLEKQVILLMISNEEILEANSEGRQWHYLAVKKLSALLRGIASKNNGGFYCQNCLHSLRTKSRLESHQKVCENLFIYVCNVIMPSQDTKILHFNHDQKSDKAPFFIYVDLECIIEKTDRCKNNPENSSAAKVSEHIPSGFSISTRFSFRTIENKHDGYRGKDCMKKFCEFLREHAKKIISFKKKKNGSY